MNSPCAICTQLRVNGYPVQLELSVLFQLPCRKHAFLHQAQAKQEESAQTEKSRPRTLLAAFTESEIGAGCAEACCLLEEGAEPPSAGKSSAMLRGCLKGAAAGFISSARLRNCFGGASLGADPPSAGKSSARLRGGFGGAALCSGPAEEPAQLQHSQ